VSELGRALIEQFDRDDLELLEGRLRALSADDADGGWLDTKKAAAYAGCTVPALHHAKANGDVEYEQPGGPGGKVWFQRSALDRWRQSRARLTA